MLIAFSNPVEADDDPLRIAMPQAMIDSGFTKHLLPRFRFKHRITLTPVPAGTEADLELAGTAGSDAGVFRSVDGTVFHLIRHSDSPDAEAALTKLRDWLTSDPGVAALEGFPADGPKQYTALGKAEIVQAVVQVDGDAVTGARLALLHCGRCHVIDKRNRMGGIGSTPSFAALRARTRWTEVFTAFWLANPHPSFTQVEGVSPPFDPSRPVHIAPIEITLEELEAIVAFAATLKPKDLGRPVQSN